MTKNYRMQISYDGTKYKGWAKQNSTDSTIQGKLEQLLNRLSYGEKPVTVIGAGRTDAGVHAKNMTCNAYLSTSMDTATLKKKMNEYLPEDITVLEIKEAGTHFHSRFNAKGKTYCYTCYYSDHKPIFDRKYVYNLSEFPNLSVMRKAAAYLTGKNDYKSFCGNPHMKKSTIRTVDLILIEQDGNYLRFFYHGDGFLQHMVRILTGTLLEVGFGKRSPESMKELLQMKDRSKAGFTAPAQGFCLESVDYN